MLNRNNDNIGYLFGRLLGLSRQASKTVNRGFAENKFQNDFISYPHKFLATVDQLTNESIKKMRANNWTKKAMQYEQERLEIMDQISPEKMPHGNSPVPIDMQGMIELGASHEEQYLCNKK